MLKEGSKLTIHVISGVGVKRFSAEILSVAIADPRYQITFAVEDLALGTTMATDNALVITTDVNEHGRILLDNGSFTDILYIDAFRRMGLQES